MAKIKIIDKIKHIFNPDPLKDYRDGPTKNEVKSDLQKKVDYSLGRVKRESFAEIDKLQTELAIRRDGLRERQLARQEKRNRMIADEPEYEAAPSCAAYYDDICGEDEEISDAPVKIDGQMSIADFIDAEIEEAIPPHSKLERVQNSLIDFNEKVSSLLRKKTNQIFKKLQSAVKKKDPENYERTKRKFRIAKVKFRMLKMKLAAFEKWSAAIAVCCIDDIDAFLDSIDPKPPKGIKRLRRRYLRFKFLIEKNKATIFHGFAGAFIIVMIIIAVAVQLTAYEYSYNGKVLGKVRHHEDVYSVLELISSELSREYDAEIAIDPSKDIKFKRVLNISAGVDSAEDVLTKLTYMRDMSVKAYAMYVNGKCVAIFNNKAAAKAVIDSVEHLYLRENERIKYEKIEFAEKLSYKWVDARLGDIMRGDEAFRKIMRGGEKRVNHYVARGDTLGSIAEKYGVSFEKLKKFNPEANPKQLTVGERIVVPVTVPLLTLQTVEIANYDESLPYAVEYKESDTIFKGERKVHRSGVSGVRKVTAKIVRHNGEEIAKMELEAKTSSLPVTEIVYVGTKPKPSTFGSGSFSWPVSGHRTSGFGKRWGRMHNGIDLAAPIGTPIRAADGGTVVQASYHSTYGNVVMINHGNGFVSLYAHCSKILVSSGTRVYKGQVIANVGNTGRSTGPHCHYEIQKGGTPVNPDNYTR